MGKALLYGVVKVLPYGKVRYSRSQERATDFGGVCGVCVCVCVCMCPGVLKKKSVRECVCARWEIQ